MYEHYFQCPCCWATISMLLDPSVPAQTYVEDCEVCCNPLEITPVFEEETLVSCEITPLGQ
jgi:hypothetical protein